MSWKGIRQGQFKNKATELVSGWKVGDLVQIDNESEFYTSNWQHFTKVGIVKAINDKDRVSPSQRRFYYKLNIQSDDESFYPSFKTNGKYKQILIQFGKIEHTVNINDNAGCNGAHVPIISPRDAEIRTELKRKAERVGLDFTWKLHTGLLALEGVFVRDYLNSADNVALSELRGSRDDSRAVLNSGFNPSFIGSHQKYSAMCGLPYIDEDGTLTVRDTVVPELSEDVQPYLPKRDEGFDEWATYVRDLRYDYDDLSDLYERHDLALLPVYEDWYWRKDGFTCVSVNIKRSWEITEDGLRLKRLRLYTSPHGASHWDHIARNGNWNEPSSDFIRSSPYGTAFNREFLRIGGEWIPQDKE